MKRSSRAEKQEEEHERGDRRARPPREGRTGRGGRSPRRGSVRIRPSLRRRARRLAGDWNSGSRWRKRHHTREGSAASSAKPCRFGAEEHAMRALVEEDRRTAATCCPLRGVYAAGSALECTLDLTMRDDRGCQLPTASAQASVRSAKVQHCATKVPLARHSRPPERARLDRNIIGPAVDVAYAAERCRARAGDCGRASLSVRRFAGPSPRAARDVLTGGGTGVAVGSV